MLYAAVYFGGIRYYPAANTVLNTAPAVKDTTSVLVLTEDGIARDYDIKVTEKYTLEGVTPSPVFSGTIQKTRTLDEVAVRNAVDDILSSVERKGGTPGYITHDCKYIPPQKKRLGIFPRRFLVNATIGLIRHRVKAAISALQPEA